MIYSLNPTFGNLTQVPDNETHIGERRFWFYQEISSFTVSNSTLKCFSLFFDVFPKYRHNISNEKNETVFDAKMQPCNKKPNKSFGDLMRMALDLDKNLPAEDFIPFLWICPLKKVRNLEAI
jgi:hypothetical protein